MRWPWTKPAPVMLRVHVAVPDRKELASIEGIFVGVEAGHYRLAAARHIEGEQQSEPLKGETWIPEARVFYAQAVDR